MQRRMALVVYVPTALLAFGQGMLVTTLPLYAAQFGVAYTLVSLAVSAAAIGTLLTDVPAGALLERIGLRRAMVIGSGMVALTTSLMALPFVELEAVIGLRLIAGIGTALWALSRHAFITQAVPPESRGQALSMFGGLSRMGAFGGPAIGGLLGDLVGFQTSFLFSGAMAGIAFLIAFLFIKPTPNPAKRLPTRDRWGVVRQSLSTHRRDLGAAAFAQTLAQMIRAGRQLLIPLYAADQIGLDASQVGLVMTASATIDMLLFLPAGLLMDRVGRKAAMVPSFTVMGIGIALIPMSNSFWTLLAAAVIVGVGNGMGAGTMMTLGADLAPPGATGEFLGLWRLIGDLGMVCGPLVVGIMAQVVGLNGSAYVLAVVGALAAVTIAFLVRETRQTPIDVTVQSGS